MNLSFAQAKSFENTHKEKKAVIASPRKVRGRGNLISRKSVINFDYLNGTLFFYIPLYPPSKGES